MTPRKAIFLDRDGTLNDDKGYVFRIGDWQWLPGAIEGIAAFNRAGWLVIVVSNQSGIARGYFDEKELASLEKHAAEDLSGRGARVDDWRYCPHLPEITGQCACRKPKAGLLLSAASDWNIDLALSWMLGDKLRDVQAGFTAGCHAALISEDPQSQEAEKCRAIYPDLPVWPNIFAASTHILALPGNVN